MKLSMTDLIRLLLPTNSTRREHLRNLKNFFDTKNYWKIKALIKSKKAGVSYDSLNTSTDFLTFSNYPILNVAVDEENTKKFVELANQIIQEKTYEDAYQRFKKEAEQKIISLIAPNIKGLDTVKLASALQLVSTENTHILLLGDPGTGKTDILRSSTEIHPKTSMGLGSGISKAGLSVAFDGKQMIKGLLPLADQGICCIDELNLMRKEDRASLYNAMEKGFITYDKANKHIRLDARISVLATANPKGDNFVGWMTDTLKKQTPFDAALLSRFHLVFLIRKPDIKEFLEITRQIIRQEKKKESIANKNFAKKYVEHSRSIEVEFPKTFEKEVVSFVESLKKKEKDYLVDISPRLVIGFIRFSKASARMNLRSKVNYADIKKVKKIFVESLDIKKKKPLVD
ncbi:hypothetical protein GOV05_00395 [Candidatus Woesearchaeota archaeon]|nr:hypothetical protein [Candidatus Woesearchaeota archaeon]